MARGIPEGLRSVTPALTVDGCAEAIETWKKAFGAEELMRAPDPTGKKIWHAAVRIGDSTFFCNDYSPEMMPNAPRQARLWIYLGDVDQAFQRAKSAGLKVVMEPGDMFWGDRICELHDRWGTQWVIAQRVKELNPAEMKKAQDEFVENMKRK
jgi:PhnB protein